MNRSAYVQRTSANRLLLIASIALLLVTTGCGTTRSPDSGTDSPSLSHWFNGGIAGKKLCLVGDSTTSHATALFSELTGTYSMPGQGLYGVGSILNFGENGASLYVFLVDGVTHGITATINEQADLYVISYGINDVRLGATTEDQLVLMLEDMVNRIRAGAPRSDIVLRMPNSFLTTDINGYHFVQPNENAQAYSTILRNAYLRVRNFWPNVVVLDSQELVFGTVSQASSPLMVDQLHPSSNGYVALAKVLVDVIGARRP